MSVQSIPAKITTANLPNNYQPKGIPFVKNDGTAGRGGMSRSFGENGSTRAAFSSTYYSSEKMMINYTNKDGDSVTINMENIEYQKAMIAVEGNENSAEWKEIVDNIKNEFLKFKETIVKKVLASVNGETEPLEEEEQTGEPAEIQGLPEYWNAENTAQRIVDFAVSFYGVAESQGRDYYEMMKNAITEGYNQAMGELGELPDEISALSQHTHELALEKLEAWAIEMGIDVSEEDSAVA